MKVILYKDYGKDAVLLRSLAYKCAPGVVNKSSILKKLKAGTATSSKPTHLIAVTKENGIKDYIIED